METMVGSESDEPSDAEGDDPVSEITVQEMKEKVFENPLFLRATNKLPTVISLVSGKPPSEVGALSPYPIVMEEAHERYLQRRASLVPKAQELFRTFPVEDRMSIGAMTTTLSSDLTELESVLLSPYHAADRRRYEWEEKVLQTDPELGDLFAWLTGRSNAVVGGGSSLRKIDELRDAVLLEALAVYLKGQASADGGTRERMTEIKRAIDLRGVDLLPRSRRGDVNLRLLLPSHSP